MGRIRYFLEWWAFIAVAGILFTGSWWRGLTLALVSAPAYLILQYQDRKKLS